MSDPTILSESNRVNVEGKTGTFLDLRSGSSNFGTIITEAGQYLDDADLAAGTPLSYTVSGTVCEPNAGNSYTINVSSTDSNLRNGFFKRVCNNGGAGSTITLQSVSGNFSDGVLAPGDLADLYCNLQSDGITYEWSAQFGGQGGQIWEHVEADPSDGDFVRLNSVNPDYDGDEGFVVPTQTMTTGAGGGTRCFFDGSTGAFRAGTTTGTEWDAASRGANSVAFGQDTTASGTASAAFGFGSTASSTGCLVAGTSNTAGGTNTAVIGGDNNTSNRIRCFIGSGTGNAASFDNSAIVGGSSNTVSASEACCVSGNGNTVSGSRAFVGAGTSNTAGGGAGAVVVGQSNNCQGQDSCITSGSTNSITAAGERAFIGSGIENSVASVQSVVVGGGTAANGNTIGTGQDYSFIGAGTSNNIANRGPTALGGGRNAILNGHSNTIGNAATTANVERNVICSGVTNTIGSVATTVAPPVVYNGNFIGAGNTNRIEGDLTNVVTYGAICSGSSNLVQGVRSFIGSGRSNEVQLDSTACGVVCGANNEVGGAGATSNNNCVIVSGDTNLIASATSSDDSVICSGNRNTVDASDAIVGAGEQNVVTSQYAGIFCGYHNSNASVAGVIAGGGYTTPNQIQGNTRNCFIGGGYGNIVYDNTFIGECNAIVTGTECTIGEDGGTKTNDWNANAILCGGSNELGDDQGRPNFCAIVAGASNRINTNGVNTDIEGSVIMGGAGNWLRSSGNYNAIVTGSSQRLLGGSNNAILAGTSSSLEGSNGAILCGGSGAATGNRVQANTTNCMIGTGTDNTIYDQGAAGTSDGNVILTGVECSIGRNGAAKTAPWGNNAIVCGEVSAIGGAHNLGRPSYCAILCGLGNQITRADDNPVDDSAIVSGISNWLSTQNSCIVTGSNNYMGTAGATAAASSFTAILSGDNNGVGQTWDTDCSRSAVIAGTDNQIGGTRNVVVQGNNCDVYDATGGNPVSGNVILDGDTVQAESSNCCIWSTNASALQVPSGNNGQFIVSSVAAAGQPAWGGAFNVGWTARDTTFHYHHAALAPGAGPAPALPATLPNGFANPASATAPGWLEMYLNGTRIVFAYWTDTGAAVPAP